MYKKVLIATDGSEISRRATASGLALARALGAVAHAVFVVDTRALPGTHPLVPESMAPYYFSLIDELRKVGEQALREVSEVAGDTEVPVTTQVLEGTPAASIIDCAREEQCELIVVGTHGRSGFAAMLLGSTAQAVVQRAEVPVLVVR